MRLGPPVLGGLLGLVLGFALAPDEASAEFYSAVAQVIPVLLLALAVQTRFFELPSLQQLLAHVRVPQSQSHDEGVDRALGVLEQSARSVAAGQRLLERILGAALLAMLVIAEFAALHPLTTGQPGDGNPEVVYIALATGFLMLGGLALVGAIEPEMSPREPER
jgi:hypothetical protein